MLTAFLAIYVAGAVLTGLAFLWAACKVHPELWKRAVLPLMVGPVWPFLIPWAVRCCVRGWREGNDALRLLDESRKLAATKRPTEAQYEVEPWMASGYTCEKCGRDNVARRLVRPVQMAIPDDPGGSTYSAWEVFDVQEIKTCAWCGATHRFSRPEVIPDAEGGSP